MRKLFLFNHISIDGYFEGPDHDLSWVRVDEEFMRAAHERMKESGEVLFGRRTYDLMARYWPTSEGQKDPETAGFLNNAQKYVVSRKKFKPEWQNTALLSGQVAAKIRRIKKKPGRDIIVLGSNALSVELLEAGLLDEIQLMVSPVALGEGTPLFTGLKRHIDLTLRHVDHYLSGNVLLTYVPAAG